MICICRKIYDGIFITIKVVIIIIIVIMMMMIIVTKNDYNDINNNINNEDNDDEKSCNTDNNDDKMIIMVVEKNIIIKIILIIIVNDNNDIDSCNYFHDYTHQYYVHNYHCCYMKQYKNIVQHKTSIIIQYNHTILTGHVYLKILYDWLNKTK